MKKTLVLIVSVLAVLGIGNAVFACEEIDFDTYGTLCVDINKDGNTYDLDIDYGDLNLSHSNAYYYVLLPNNGGGLLSPRLTDTYSEFNYNYRTYDDYDSEIRKIKVYAIIGSEVRSTEVYYDFVNGEWEGDGGGGTSNGDLDNFYITLSDSTPAEDDEVTLNIKARDSDDDQLDDYDGSNAEINVEYRTSSSNSRYDATSSYVSIDDETPTFSNGSASTHITFKYEYEYRVTVTDDDEDIDDYKIFDVGGVGGTSDGDLDNFYITLSDSTPAEDDEVTLNIKARDNDNVTLSDYDGSNAEITIEYRTSSSSSRYDATSSYVSIDDETPTFSNGSASTHITFKYEYEYRVTVTDDDEDIDDYKIFDVGGAGGTSDGDLDNFYITLSDSTPAEDDEITLNIKARDNDNVTLSDYDGSNAEINVEYRASSNSSRRDATSSYVSIDDTTPTFSNGSASTHITFKYEYEYRITVTDTDNDNIYDSKIFDVGGNINDNNTSDGEVDNFYVTKSDSSPDTNERIDLTIKVRDNDNYTVNDYTDDVEFTIYQRASSASVRTKTTSSNYYELGSSYDNGYDFSSSDYGIATLDNFIKFKQRREYKVVVEDANDASINGYTLFDLRNQTSDVDGFSVTELEALTKIYNSRNRMISNLKSSYPKLKSNDTWIDKSDTFYDNMKEVIDAESNRTFDDYSDYLDAFKDRYNYTIDHR